MAGKEFMLLPAPPTGSPSEPLPPLQPPQVAAFLKAEGGARLLDLLLVLLYSASFGGRVLLSFPDRRVKAGERSFYNNESNAPDVAVLQSVLQKTPGVGSMLRLALSTDGEAALHEHLDGIDTLLYPLLAWLTEPHLAINCGAGVGSRILPDHEKPEGLGCECIVRVASTSAKESSFQARKASSGKPTLLGFHGSCNGNWHSIVRTGIKVMSGTEFQTTGTSYGRGIYLGSHSSISASYCKNRGSAWPASEFFSSEAPTMSVMALVEIIDHEEELKAHPCSTGIAAAAAAGSATSTSTTGASQIYVTANENLYITRFLLVNPDSTICCHALLEKGLLQLVPPPLPLPESEEDN